MILLVRDPRDIIVSYFHQVTKRSDAVMRFDSLSHFIRDPVYGFDRILRFYDVWYRNRATPRRFLLVKYEGLLSDSPAELIRITHFLGVSASSDTVEEAYELSRADNMRKLEL